MGKDKEKAQKEEQEKEDREEQEKKDKEKAEKEEQEKKDKEKAQKEEQEKKEKEEREKKSEQHKKNGSLLLAAQSHFTPETNKHLEKLDSLFKKFDIKADMATVLLETYARSLMANSDASYEDMPETLTLSVYTHTAEPQK